MGTVLSFLNLTKLYQSLLDFHQAINGNWFLYFNFLFKSFVKSLKSKSRFDLYDIETDGDPYAIGILPPPQEWTYECPRKDKSEKLLIYGTNTWGQYLVIEIKWRPQNTNQINGSVRLIFKDQNQLIYELNENDLLTIESNNQLKQYKIAGLTVQVLCPYRKLRIKVRGLLRRRDTNELLYSRIRFFWSPLSNIFDFQNDFDNKYMAKELSALGINELKTEDRHEQWGQLQGTVQIGDDSSKEVFLWGNKAKQYLNNDFRRKVTRIYGFDSKSFAFHVGTVRSTDNFRLRYGYVSLGNGSVYPVSGISSTFSELESIGSTQPVIKNFKLDIEDQKREFEVEIGDQIEEYDNLIIHEMKLNGHNGRCLIINEEFSEAIDFVSEETENKLAKDLVILISDVRSRNVELSGGKGASLATLTQMANTSEFKFSVPKGLIVTTNAYKELIDQSELISNEIDKLEKVSWSEKRETLQKCCQEVSEMFGKQKMPKNLVEKIKDYLQIIFGHNYESIRFAVRSSALNEDSGEMSSAGQMTTILGVKGLEAIIDAIMKCWSSQFTFVAVEYKRGYGQEINSPMAVVVQEMVDSDSAGVIFTCDPITGDERNVLITANYGIGESVVSAMAEPDTIRLSVNIEANSLLKKRYVKDIEKIEIGSKLKSIVLNYNNESGTRGQTNTTNNRECCLTEDECRKLADIALEVHRNYGDPRDIEWGIKDNQIYLLQSRPITNLDNWTEWEAMHDMDSGQQSESEYFSRANLGEVFPGASSHLCLSWLINVWNGNGFRNWRKMFNLSSKEFSPYYNRGGGIVNNHYFFLLKTGTFPFVGDPKSTISKSIQIGMFGHEFDGEEYDDLMKDSTEKAPKRSTSLYNKIWLFLGSIKYFLTPGRTLRQAKKEMAHMDLFRGKLDFTAKDIFKAILDGYDLNCSIAYAHGKVSFCSMMYNMVLLEILKKNNPNNENDCYADFSRLVSSTSEVVSAQVPNLLADIANSIKNRHKFKEMSDEKALKYLLYSETEEGLKFKRFLIEYGHRGYKEFDPFALQWGDNPIGLIKSIKTMMNGDQRLRQMKKNQSIDEIISSLKSPLSKKSKFLLKYLVIPWCQSGIMLREQGKHAFTWSNNVYRRGFWRLAHQMVIEGRLPEPELLFHMTTPEIQTLLNERDPTIISRARLRKKLHSKMEKFKFPETTIGPKILPRNEMADTFAISAEGEVARIKGTPVSAGKIKGRCCVALNLEEAQNIQSGDILITYSTDIGWSPYFPMLSGLATEIGGLISHGAVIAREYGLPCLVGVEDAHRLFKTGDTIVIDADIGEIYKI